LTAVDDADFALCYEAGLAEALLKEFGGDLDDEMRAALTETVALSKAAEERRNKIG
jgi:hypothetical protein